MFVFVRSNEWVERQEVMQRDLLSQVFSCVDLIFRSVGAALCLCGKTSSGGSVTGERACERGDDARDGSANSWGASTDPEAQLHSPKRRCEPFGEGIGLLLIMWRSGWTWGWNAGCEEVVQQQLISDVYHAWAVFKVGKTVENITPNIRSFIWRERWAISELCLTLIMRRVINTQTIRPL